MLLGDGQSWIDARAYLSLNIQVLFSKDKCFEIWLGLVVIDAHHPKTSVITAKAD